MKMSIPTPAQLTIGDPWYMEMPEEKVKKLVFNSKFPKTFVSSLSVEHDAEEGLYDIKICIAPDAKMLALYESGKYLATLTHKEMLLGCDTACFEISTPDRYINVSTMADGYFGDAHRFTLGRKNQGAIINLYICDDAFDKRNVEELKYVFKKEN